MDLTMERGFRPRQPGPGSPRFGERVQQFEILNGQVGPADGGHKAS